MRKIKEHFTPIFLLALPLIWMYVFEDRSTHALWISMGGILSSSAFYYRDIKSRKKIETVILQHIQSKLKDEFVLLSVEEMRRLGPLMKHFTKQEGKIANATNNIHGLSRYKISAEMKRKLSKT